MNYMARNTDSAIEQLRALMGPRLSTAMAVRQHHGTDASWHQALPPDAVVFAHSTEEVSKIMQVCAATGTPVIPYGVGSSIEGHISALQGGVTIDLSEMNQIVAVHEADLDATVQPGVTR